MTDKLLTLHEAAELLRVSRHTVQAWISPSSPNHKPEFAIMARHAGRRTVLVEAEILSWLNQRRGAVYAEIPAGRTAYWREHFIAGRGLLRGLIKSPDRIVSERIPVFAGGLLAFDVGPLLSWLTDGDGSAALLAIVGRAEGLVLPVPLALWILKRAARTQGRYAVLHDFILTQNIFELAVLDEAALRRAIDLPANIADISLQSYCCSLEAGASMFITGDRGLLKTPGLPVSGY